MNDISKKIIKSACALHLCYFSTYLFVNDRSGRIIKAANACILLGGLIVLHVCVFFLSGNLECVLYLSSFFMPNNSDQICNSILSHACDIVSWTSKWFANDFIYGNIYIYILVGTFSDDSCLECDPFFLGNIKSTRSS